jgi:hypothetical protein
MGQRSQIYVRYEVEGEKKLVARYFQWNYGERMISRARYTMDWLKKTREYLSFENKKIVHILETNFDIVDCVESLDIMQEYNDYAKEEGEDTFKDAIMSEDNNDGILFIDVLTDKIKYGFLDWKPNTDHVMTARKYMDFDMKGWNKRDHSVLDKEEYTTCIRNIKAIDCDENHELMTSEEIEEFINYDYSAQLTEYKKEA